MSDALADRLISTRQLYALIGLLALGVLPHFWHLHPSLSAFFMGGAALKLMLWRKPGQRVPRYVLFLLAIAAILLVVIRVGVTEGHQFGVSLLVVMLGLKLLEMRSRRDLYVVVILGYFVMITQFLYDQGGLLTAAMFLLVIGLTAVLNSANRLEQEIAPAETLKRAGLSLALSLPVMLVLFVLFPRLSGPLWSFNLGGAAISGMSDHIGLGSVSKLSLSPEPAFRVEFDDEVPPPQDRYWRGLVLWTTDGRNWERAENAAVVDHPAGENNTSVGYQVTMETSRQRWLFPLDRVESKIPTGTANIDGEVTLRQSIQQRFNFHAYSSTAYLDTRLSDREQQLGLQLPDRGTPRMRALVKKWQSNTASNRDLVSVALDYFNTEPFIYTLEPPSLGRNPIDKFLFDTRMGFCEHYATSLVYLMRLAGIPSRVIVGYQGGELNPLGGHLLVRQADAHAWAEIWLQDEGWVRVDPTAAVAPERIMLSLNPGLYGEGAPALFHAGNLGALGGLLQNWGWLKDNMTMQWYNLVVNFDKRQQQNLLKRWGLEFLKGAGLGITAIGVMLAAGLIGFLASLLSSRTSLSPLQKSYLRFRRKLQRAGLDVPDWIGPLDLGKSAAMHFPENRVAIDRILSLYIALRYGKTNQTSFMQQMHLQVRQLKLKPLSGQ